MGHGWDTGTGPSHHGERDTGMGHGDRDGTRGQVLSHLLQVQGGDRGTVPLSQLRSGMLFR